MPNILKNKGKKDGTAKRSKTHYYSSSSNTKIYEIRKRLLKSYCTLFTHLYPYLGRASPSMLCESVIVSTL